MKVRAKFRCTSMRMYENNVWKDGKPQPGFTYAYEFQAVTGGFGNSENDAFFASTPTGNLTLGSVRDDLFVPGKEYYLDFTMAVPVIAQ